MPTPLCDMTLDELRDERRRLHKLVRQAPAWSARLETSKMALDECDAWIRRRSQQQEGAHG